jgi:anthranilate phosphoribosyltransferase
VLQQLGVNIEAPPAVVTRCLKEASVGFCFAVLCHPAMRHAAKVRRALPIKTIFNILGPLTNPAGAKRQIMGVYDKTLTEPLAEVLGKLGSQRAWVLCSQDGLDEISIAGPTKISQLQDGKVTTWTIRPEDFGLASAQLETIFVDSAQASAQALRDVLTGQTGPRRDIVLLNAAGALVLAELAEDMSQALAMARKSIDSGAAQATLEKMIAITNE